MASTDDDGVSFIDKIDIVCCVLWTAAIQLYHLNSNYSKLYN